MGKDGLAIAFDMLIEPDAGAGLGHDRCKRGLADLKRIAPQVVVVQLDQVEGVEEYLVVSAVMPDEIERGNTVVIAGDSFAVDNAGARAYLSGKMVPPLTRHSMSRPVPRSRFEISWSVPTSRLVWVVLGYSKAARWQCAVGREWRQHPALGKSASTRSIHNVPWVRWGCGTATHAGFF